MGLDCGLRDTLPAALGAGADSRKPWLVAQSVLGLEVQGAFSGSGSVNVTFISLLRVARSVGLLYAKQRFSCSLW